MAFAQKRGDIYRVVFHFGGKKFRKSSKTNNASIADAVVGGIKRTLLMLEQGLLQMPEGADVLSFVLSGGQEVKLPHVTPAAKVEVPTLGNLRSQCF